MAVQQSKVQSLCDSWQNQEAKMHFSTPSHKCRKIRSPQLHKELRQKYDTIGNGCILKDDDMQVVQRYHKCKLIEKAVQFCRKKYVIHIEWV